MAVVLLQSVSNNYLNIYQNHSTPRNGVPIGPLAQSSWLRVYPEGIYKITQYATQRYGRPEIRITGEWGDAAKGLGRSVIVS